MVADLYIDDGRWEQVAVCGTKPAGAALIVLQKENTTWLN